MKKIFLEKITTRGVISLVWFSWVEFIRPNPSSDLKNLQTGAGLVAPVQFQFDFEFLAFGATFRVNSTKKWKINKIY